MGGKLFIAGIQKARINANVTKPTQTGTEQPANQVPTVQVQEDPKEHPKLPNEPCPTVGKDVPQVSPNPSPPGESTPEELPKTQNPVGPTVDTPTQVVTSEEKTPEKVVDTTAPNASEPEKVNNVEIPTETQGTENPSEKSLENQTVPTVDSTPAENPAPTTSDPNPNGNHPENQVPPTEHTNPTENNVPKAEQNAGEKVPENPGQGETADATKNDEKEEQKGKENEVDPVEKENPEKVPEKTQEDLDKEEKKQKEKEASESGDVKKETSENDKVVKEDNPAVEIEPPQPKPNDFFGIQIIKAVSTSISNFFQAAFRQIDSFFRKLKLVFSR